MALAENVIKIRWPTELSCDATFGRRFMKPAWAVYFPGDVMALPGRQTDALIKHKRAKHNVGLSALCRL